MAACPYCGTPLADALAEQCPSCGGALLPGAAPEAAPPPLPGPQDAPPAGPYGDANAPGGVHPAAASHAWDERHRVGIMAAFVETTRQVLATPSSFFQGMPVSGGLGSPLLYAVVAGWIGLVAAAFYQAIWVSIVGPSSLPFGLDRGELAYVLEWLESGAGLLTQVVFGGVSVVISVFVAAGILHLMLLMLGGARRGFEATFRVVCFSQATMLLLLIPLFLIPFCGLAPVAWCLALYAIGLAPAHRIGHGQAVAAVLLPIVALCCCCMGVVATFAGAIASLVGYTQ